MPVSPEATPRGRLAHLRVAGMPPPTPAQSRVEQVQSFVSGRTCSAAATATAASPTTGGPAAARRAPTAGEPAAPVGRTVGRAVGRAVGRPAVRPPAAPAAAPRTPAERRHHTEQGDRAHEADEEDVHYDTRLSFPRADPPWVVRDGGMPSRLTGQSEVEQLQRVLTGEHLLTCADIQAGVRRREPDLRFLGAARTLEPRGGI